MPLDEEELYQERIQDYYEEPYHRGRCPDCTHAHEDNNPLCGDVIRLELQIDDQGTLKEVYFNGDGCCISQAAASMLVEKFDGQRVEDVKRFTAKDMLDLFGVRLTPNRQKCCLLSWRVLQAAIYSPAAERRRSGRRQWLAASKEECVMLEVQKPAAFDPETLSARFPHSRPRGPPRRAAGLSRQRGHQPAAAAGDSRRSSTPTSSITPTSIAASTPWPKRSTNSTRAPGRRSGR